MSDLVKRLKKAAKFGGHYEEAATEIERLQAKTEIDRITMDNFLGQIDRLQARNELLEKALTEIRKEAGDWIQGIDTATNKTSRPAVTVKIIYQMTDAALKT